MFNIDAIIQTATLVSEITDQSLSAAMLINQVLEMDVGEIFVDNTIAPVNSQWIYETQEVDLQELTGDEDLDNWTTESVIDSINMINDAVRPSASLEDILLGFE